MLRSVTLALVAALVACGEPPPPPSCPGCNVVLVTFDALRPDHLGAYGHRAPTSPAIDALAARSAVFTNSVSQCGTTAGSVPSILTSRFVVADRLLDGLRLRADQPTIGTVLHAAGYRTLALLAHEYARCAYSGCAGFDVTDDQFPAVEPAAKTAERVSRMLAEEARPPFFLWVHVRQPHMPFVVAAEDFATMYAAKAGALTYFSPEVRTLGFLPATSKLVGHYQQMGEPVTRARVVDGRTHDLTPTVMRQMQALYDANVLEGDRVFAQLIEQLERRGLAARTIVVVAADHGESLGEHRWFGHNRLWQVILHTPLIVYVPGAPHRTIDAPVMNVDILPTITRLVGVPLASPVRGRDLFGPRSADDLQYAEYSTSYVVMQRHMKAQVNPTAQTRTDKPTTAPAYVETLCDLQSDPAEEKNLVADRPELAARLMAAGEALRSQSLGGDAPVPEDLRERLRALGYIAPDAPRDD
jgi:arylsulfatase A-like enzyme